MYRANRDHKANRVNRDRKALPALREKPGFKGPLDNTATLVRLAQRGRKARQERKVIQAQPARLVQQARQEQKVILGRKAPPEPPVQTVIP